MPKETEEKIQLIDIESIVVKKDRYRKEHGDIESLAASIKDRGQLVPIIISESHVLIAGERRLMARKLLKHPKIQAIVRSYDEIEQKIIEIIENVDRKDFTWQEAVIATEELHNLLKAKYGSSTVRKTAQKAKMSYGGVSTDLQLAQALKDAPDIFEKCRTKEQALKSLKKYQLDEAMAELALRKSKGKYGIKAKNHLFQGDARELIKKLPDDHINVILTDPPYGINVFETMFHSNEEMPPENKDSFGDSEAYFKQLILDILPDFDRVLKPNAGLLSFCAYSHSQWLIDAFKSIGFNMDTIPGVWVKKANMARTNVPERYFNRSYELFVYGTRGEFTLAKAGTCNTILCQGIATMDRLHPTEKPLELAEDLVSRFCLPGHVTLDPFAGSCVFLVAAIKRGCIPIGFEADHKFYMAGLQRLAKAIEMKDAALSGEVR